MSELRITEEEQEISETEKETSETEREILETESIKPGSKSICHASVQLLLDHHEIKTRKVKAKLDSCGSVSIAHSNLLNSIKPSGHYKLPHYLQTNWRINKGY